MISYSVEYGEYEFVDVVLIICLAVLGTPVGHNHAACHRLMTEKTAETGKGAALHLEVGDAQSVVFKTLNLVVQFGIGKREAQTSALWAVESATGTGDAPDHIVAGDTGEK